MNQLDKQEIAVSANVIMRVIGDLNKRWWKDLNTGKPIKRNIGELLMLVVSELAEAMEGDRKNLMDSHLPHRKMFDVELVDCLIRIFDTCSALEIPVGEILVEKLEYNEKREDHKIENRRKENGKKY
jgi:NTP pyrophosphatase (non-canonical NTP hydrolase)